MANRLWSLIAFLCLCSCLQAVDTSKQSAVTYFDAPSAPGHYASVKMSGFTTNGTTVTSISLDVSWQVDATTGTASNTAYAGVALSGNATLTKNFTKGQGPQIGAATVTVSNPTVSGSLTAVTFTCQVSVYSLGNAASAGTFAVTWDATRTTPMAYTVRLVGGSTGAYYSVMQNGRVLDDSLYVGPGVVNDVSFDLWSGAPLTLTRYPNIVVKDKNGNQVATRATNGTVVFTGTPTEGGSGGDTTTPTTSGGTSGTVWTSGGDSTALREATYRQGVEKIIEAVKSAGGSGSGGTSVSMAGVETRLDTTNERLKTIADQVEADKAKAQTLIEQAGQAGTSASNGVSSATASGSSAASAVTLQSFGTLDVQPSEASSVTVEAKVGSQTVSIDINPLTSNRPPNDPIWTAIKGALGFTKSLLGLGAILGFCGYAVYEIRKAMMGVMTVPQFNPHAAERAAAASLASAVAVMGVRAAVIAVMAGVLATLPAALVFLLNDGGWVTALITHRAAAQSAASSSMGVLSWAEMVVPVKTLLAVGVSYCLFEWAILPIQTLWVFMLKLCL